MHLSELVTLSAAILEVAGIAVILGGAAVVAVRTALRAAVGPGRRTWYAEIRQGTGRAILLGLEFLVGADIIRTTAEAPTLNSVAVLAGIVLIRTFLSFTLEVELEGTWPWQSGRGSPDPRSDKSC